MEGFFGGPAGGGMTLNTVPPESALQTLTMEMFAREMARIPRRTPARLPEGCRVAAVRPGPVMDTNGDPCTCPSCWPDRRRPVDSEQARAEAFADLERKIREVSRRKDVSPCPEESRSIDLMKEWLSPDQRAQFDWNASIDVKGSSGRRYRIYRATISNVMELDDNGIGLRGWCFGPEGDAGRWTGDVMLTQMLALATDEEAALRRANLWWGRPPAGWVPQPLNPFRRPLVG
jgi:hypothetical protein